MRQGAPASISLLTAVLTAATILAQVSTSSDRPVSPTVVASWMTRGENLTLLVLWRGSPGWFWRGDHQGGGGGGNGTQGFQQIQYDGRTLRVDYDLITQTATIAGRELSLRETNVVMVDFVDSVGGPTVVDSRYVDPSLVASVQDGASFDAGLVVIARESTLFSFLECELSLPPPPEPEPIADMKRALIATTCDRVRPR
jgi:hypothetical protein